MSDERKIWLNGKIIPWAEGTVHIASHGFSRASAIFDFAAVYHRRGVSSLFRLDVHIQRLMNTARLLGLNLNRSPEELAEAVREACRANHLKEGFVKIMAYLSGDGTLSLVLDDPLDLAIFTLDPGDMKELTQPISACLVGWRKIHPATVPVEAKACSNYLNSMLARRTAVERGYDIGLMLDTEGYVAEGSIESFFIVEKGRLKTAPLGTILSSVSRKTLIDLAPHAGVEIVEERFTPAALISAEEMFFAGTPYRVKPIWKFESRELEAPGPVSRKMQAYFEGIVSGENEGFENWFTPL